MGEARRKRAEEALAEGRRLLESGDVHGALRLLDRARKDFVQEGDLGGVRELRKVVEDGYRLADAQDEPAYERLLAQCERQEIAAKFRDMERLRRKNELQYEMQTGASRRLLEAVCGSEVVRLRSITPISSALSMAALALATSCSTNVSLTFSGSPTMGMVAPSRTA